MPNVVEILNVASYPLLVFGAGGPVYLLYQDIRKQHLERTRFAREVGREPENYGFRDKKEFQRYKNWLVGWVWGKHVGRDEDPRSILERYPSSDLRTVR